MANNGYLLTTLYRYVETTVLRAVLPVCCHSLIATFHFLGAITVALNKDTLKNCAELGNKSLLQKWKYSPTTKRSARYLVSYLLSVGREKIP